MVLCRYSVTWCSLNIILSNWLRHRRLKRYPRLSTTVTGLRFGLDCVVSSEISRTVGTLDFEYPGRQSELTGAELKIDYHLDEEIYPMFMTHAKDDWVAIGL